MFFWAVKNKKIFFFVKKMAEKIKKIFFSCK